jgi:hypothetical protein
VTGGESRPAAGASSLLALVLLAGLVASGGSCRKDSTEADLRDIEKAYYSLRDALLNGDDEAFFALHSAEARRWALDSFPGIRAGYVAADVSERQAFEKLYHVGSKEFLEAEPRAMVVKMMPWKSGWRERRGMFRAARVKDVRIDHLEVPDPAGGGGKTVQRRGIVVLEPADPAGRGTSDEALPSVVFVKEEGGWRRHAFFTETGPGVGGGERPGK